MSVDHVPCIKAWAESLGGITFPLLSDFWPHGAAAQDWGVFRDAEGISERAIFIIDAEGVIQYVDVHDIADQPSNEVLFAELERITGLSAGEPVAPAPSGEGTGGAPAAGQGAESMPQTGASGGAQGGAQAAATAGGVGAVEPNLGQMQVTMYCRTWCPDCARARSWLDQRGIAYVEIDVDSDVDARQRAAGHNEGRLHTPTFEIGEDVCVDFRPERLTELLGIG